MKLRNILATSVAAVVAVSSLSVSAFALSTADYLIDGTVYVTAEKDTEPDWSADSGVAVTDVYGVTYHVEFNADEVADEAAWIGGGIGANSVSTGWKQVEWGRNSKEITADLENGTITWLNDEPIFTADDAYAQLWLQTWGGTVTVLSADILGADGVVLSTDDVAADDADEAADEDTADEDTADEDAADEDVAEDDAADEDVAEDDAADEDVAEDDAAEEDTAEEDTADTTTEDTTATTGDKTTPDTGVEGVAAVAGLAIVAAGAVIVAKKRK